MDTKSLIFYQIYPKSFCDSDNDGFGDINGIRSKIEYLKTLGVNAIWLSPCFESPNVDNGYDISDYRKIDRLFGSMEEFRLMIEEFHAKDMLVILDLVANHTSTKHAWFLQSRKSKDNPYRDYYIWYKTPPNDWQSAFGGSAWEYDPLTEEYYLHSYAVEQADLNWENPKVREEMKAVVDFWLKMGVDGFRCDVLDQISKDFENGKNGNGPRLHEYIRELFGREEMKGIFTVGECWSSNLDNAHLFCGKDRKELTCVFSFEHLCLTNDKFTRKKPALYEVCKRMADWQKSCQKLDLPNTVFLENHDQPRSVSRFADDDKYRYESATMLGGWVLLQRGIPFLYQGQEIGMTNSYHESIDEFDDVETLNYYQKERANTAEKNVLKNINFIGRDNARRPIPWTKDCMHEKSWISPYTKGGEINVEKDVSSRRSVYDFYRRLIKLRKSERCLTEGTFSVEELTEKRYVFSRALQGDKITVICNFDKTELFEKTKYGDTVLLNNYSSFTEVLQPYQLLVIKN